MPQTQQRRSTRHGEPVAQKPVKRGTPIRNGMLLVLFAVVVAAMVLIFPKEPSYMGNQATVMTDGSTGGTVAEGTKNIRISEVMASNRRAYPDAHGNYPDWVEIENTGDAPVNLGGIGLSDRDNRILFIFPDMELAPGEFTIVFCDDTNQAVSGLPLHARFKISALGETIYLFDQTSLVFDSVTVPALNSDTSYARDGEKWFITEKFTPGYPNTQEGYDAFHQAFAAPATGLVLNELVASNVTTLMDEDGDFSDWIELYNGGSLPIDLSNYALSDDATNPVKWRFPSGATIKPGEYYVVFASGKNRPGTGTTLPHTNFSLAAEGETVVLSTILSQVIDQVTYDNLGKDESYGRVPGLEYTWQVYKNPTPNLPNNHEGAVKMDEWLRARNGSGIFISEVVTTSTGIETAYGKTSYDWIELVNLSAQSVDLTGWGLSDRVNHPRKWQFPAGTKIGPGERLLVFASGLGKSPVNSGAIHSTFRLSALGETVVLSDPKGNIYDKLVVPKLEVNNSYGRDFDRGGLFYYETPTPGEPNTTQGFIGYSPKPAISKKGGMYTQPIQVSLSAPDGVTIYYTTDGSIPTQTTGTLYTGSQITVSQTCVLRVRGFMEGYKGSEVATETFLFNKYHNMPVISITMDPDDLWNPVTGIYADGDSEVTGETFEKPSFKFATYWVIKKNTMLRERDANIEFYTLDGKQHINQGVSVMLNGQYSMDLPQKSLRITARSRFGAPTLAYPFFDDRPYDEYQAIVLRNGGNMSHYARITDSLLSKIMDWTDTKVIHMAATPCVVYLNGEYWGQYYIRERINKHYIARYEGWTDPDAIDFIKGDRQVLNGNLENYSQLLEYVRNHDLNDPKALETVKAWVDIDNYFDFMIFEMYFNNTDTGNIKFYRQKNNGAAQWKWIVYDLDWALDQRKNDGCFIWLDPDGSGSRNFENVLIRKLLKVPELQDKFLTRYGKLFQEVFSDTDRILALMDEMVKEIEPEMGLTMNRFAPELRATLNFDPPKDGAAAVNYWKSRVGRLKNIICGRPYYAWTETKAWFELTDDQMTAYFGPCPEETTDIY